MDFKNYSTELSNFANLDKQPAKRAIPKEITPLTDEALAEMKYAFENHGECAVRYSAQCIDTDNEEKNNQLDSAEAVAPNTSAQNSEPETIVVMDTSTPALEAYARDRARAEASRVNWSYVNELLYRQTAEGRNSQGAIDAKFDAIIQEQFPKTEK
jgi:hypothetical protein